MNFKQVFVALMLGVMTTPVSAGDEFKLSVDLYTSCYGILEGVTAEQKKEDCDTLRSEIEARAVAEGREQTADEQEELQQLEKQIKYLQK